MEAPPPAVTQLRPEIEPSTRTRKVPQTREESHHRTRGRRGDRGGHRRQETFRGTCDLLSSSGQGDRRTGGDLSTNPEEGHGPQGDPRTGCRGSCTSDGSPLIPKTGKDPIGSQSSSGVGTQVPRSFSQRVNASPRSPSSS